MQKIQIKKDTAMPLFLFLITIVSRIPFRSRVLYHWDSVQYALATEHYDISVHQPHPPGYFLYVMLGKLLNAITQDPNTSFVTMSILASGAFVVAVYALAKRMSNENTALAASLLAITSPLVWFHGEVALNYILEGFLSTLIAYYCWRTINGEEKLILAASLALAFAAGIRQTMLMFLLPLWLLALVKVRLRYRLYAFLLLVLGIFSWYCPMISLTGGYTKYREASQELFTFVIEPKFHFGASNFPYFPKTVFLFTLQGLNLSMVFFLFYFLTRSLTLLKNDLFSVKGLFFAMWIFPSLLFYILIFISLNNPGYSLIYLPAIIILAASALTKTAAVSKNTPRWFFAAFLGTALIFNAYMFIFSNSDTSYGFLKAQEERLNAFIEKVRSSYAPEDTAILCRGNVFFGPRHFMYYLPEYRVYIMNESLPMQKKARQVFWGQYHATHLSDEVHLPPEVKYFLSSDESRTMKWSPPNLYEEIIFEVNAQFRFYLYDIRLARNLYPTSF